MMNFINSSALTKLLANVFVFLVMIAALAIAGYDTLKNLAINPYVSALIGSGLMYAGTILGFHVGGVQALQAQSQIQTPAAAAPAPVLVAAPAAPVDPEATQQRPAVTIVPGTQTRSTTAAGA